MQVLVSIFVKRRRKIASFFFVNWCDYADLNCRPIA